MLKLNRIPLSFRNYVNNITSILTKQGVEFVFFSKESDIPYDVDLYWDPFSGPRWFLRKVKRPLVVTMLGDYRFGTRLKDAYSEEINYMRKIIKRYVTKLKLRLKWTIFSKKVSAVITVSNYSKEILAKHLGINRKKIYVIYHGINHHIFNPNARKIAVNFDYFLHVSQYSPDIYPKKNIKRIVQAFIKLKSENPMHHLKLILIIPNIPKRISEDLQQNRHDIIIIPKKIPHQKLVEFYRGALALVFPSIHESFGFPILEAMASGCPVITSNLTACPEIANDSAILVDPYSVEDIKYAMLKIMMDKKLREELIERGLNRASQFSWEKSAFHHLQLFKHVVIYRGGCLS